MKRLYGSFILTIGLTSGVFAESGGQSFLEKYNEVTKDIREQQARIQYLNGIKDPKENNIAIRQLTAKAGEDPATIAALTEESARLSRVFREFRNELSTVDDQYRNKIKETIASFNVPSLLSLKTLNPQKFSPPWYGSYSKNDMIELSITILTFDSVYNETRIQDELDQFNKIYAHCGITLKSPVPIRIFSSQGLDLVFSANLFGMTQATEAHWGFLQKQYEPQGIPVMILKYDDDRMGFGPELSNKGTAVIRGREIYENDESRKLAEKTFPQFSIFLTDYNDPHVAAKNIYEDAIVTLAHEVGHIVFQEGHNDSRHNLMRDFGGKGKSQRSSATGISGEQCQKARQFIEGYTNRIDSM